MSKILDHIQQTRQRLARRAKAVTTYFKSGGGVPANDDQEPPQLAWTSDEQKQRSREFRELAEKLANKNEAA